MYSNLLLQMDNIQLDGPTGYMNMDPNGILISGPTGTTKMGSTGITISKSDSNVIAELDLAGSGISMRAYEGGLTQFDLNTVGVLVQSGNTPQSITWNNLATKMDAISAISPAYNSSYLNVNNTVQIQNGQPPTSTIVISCADDIPQFLINDSAGYVGQAIVNTTSGIAWGDVSTSTPTLQQVVLAGRHCDQTITMDGMNSAQFANLRYDRYASYNGDVNIRTDVNTGFNYVNESTIHPATNVAVNIKLVDLNSKASLTFNDINAYSLTSATQSAHYNKSNNGMTIMDQERFRIGTGTVTDDNPTLTHTSIEINQGGIGITNDAETATGMYSSERVYLNNTIHNVEFNPADIIVDGVSGVEGQALLKTATSYGWGDITSASTLQQVLDVPDGNLTTTAIVSVSGSSTNSINGLGMTITDTGTGSPLAEYSTGGIYLYQTGIPDNIEISPSITLNLTQSGTGGGGITSHFNGNDIDRHNTYQLQQVMDGITGLPTLSQSLTEQAGANINVLQSSPSALTIARSGGQTQTLSYADGLKVDKIQSNTTTNLQIINGVEFTGDVNFTLATPHCSVSPEYGNDLVNKLYVDSRIASGGNNFLYLNFSVASDSKKQLGSSIVITDSQSLIFQTGDHLIASFITDIGSPNITSIPSGIWELNQFGMCDANHTGTLYYYFIIKLYKPTTNTYRELGRSVNSATVDALTTPALYFSTLSLATTACELEERIVIEVYSVGVGTGAFNTYYQGDYYSYITCPLLTGANLLNLNNSWTGTNTFTVNPIITSTMPIGSDTSTTIPTTAWTQSALTNLKANTNTWALSQTFTTVPINNGTIGLGSASNTNVPTTAWTQSALTYFKTQVNEWSGVQTFSTLPTISATMSINLNDTTISTTAWVNSKITRALNSFKTQVNEWSGVQTFSTLPTISATMPVWSDTSTTIPTTAWVQSALTHFKTQVNEWSGVQTFSTLPTISAPIPSGTNNETIATTSFVNSFIERGQITPLSITGDITFTKTYTAIPLVIITVVMNSGTAIVACCLSNVFLTTASYILSSTTGVAYLNYIVLDNVDTVVEVPVVVPELVLP